MPFAAHVAKVEAAPEVVRIALTWPAAQIGRRAGGSLWDRASLRRVRDTSEIWTSTLTSNSRNGIRPPARRPARSVVALTAHDAPKVPTVRRESPPAPNAMLPLAPSNSTVARASAASGERR